MCNFSTPHQGFTLVQLLYPYLDYLMDSGKLVKLSPSIVLAAEAYQDAEARVVAYLEENGQVTLGETRDLLDTSRRYAQALLEHMDRVRVTKRVGDARVLRG